MARRHPVYRALLVSLFLLPLATGAGLARGTRPAGAAASGAPVAPAPRAALVATPTALAVPTPGTPAAGTGGTDSGTTSSLLQDEQTLLNNPIPDLTTGVPLSTVPPITGSVAGVETSIVGLLGRLQTSSLSAGDRSAVSAQLQDLNAQLAPAIDLQDKIAGLRDQENALLQARLDGQAAIDGISARIQVNLDKLRVNVESTVNADVTASVGAISITVSGGADTIQAQLGAQVNRLLVNVLTDIDVLHIATLHATANVDTARLNVNLFVQVKKLRLDLRLLLTKLQVHVRADVAAAVMAEASLTASLAAEVDGLKADLSANIDTKVSGLDALLTTLVTQLNGDLARAATTVRSIRARVG